MATKNIRREALYILRDFALAGELSTTADITSVREKSPRLATRLIFCTFAKTAYVIIIDSTVDDDIDYLRSLLEAEIYPLAGSFVQNPKESSFKTYAISHKFKDTYVFEIASTVARLDTELVRRFPEFSRSTLQKYIKAGYVRVDGTVTTKPKTDVSSVSTITLEIPPKADYSNQEFPIVYLDDEVIAIIKPSGVLTHSKGAMNDEFTVADFFRRYTTFGLETNRPGIVHRLDRDTSGVILGARTKEAADHLKKQFAQRKVKKHYEALIDGVPKLPEARIDVPIGRNPTAPSTFRADASGKSALTNYHVRETSGNRSLVSLFPETGRTHQLRVHMQYIGTPILGDKVYGTAKLAPRLCLHAKSLECTLPNGTRKTFTTPVPAEFEEILHRD